MSERKTLNLRSPHICYITSGKSGLESFTFRELESLIEEYGVDVELCLTQLKKGKSLIRQKTLGVYNR